MLSMRSRSKAIGCKVYGLPDGRSVVSANRCGNILCLPVIAAKLLRNFVISTVGVWLVEREAASNSGCASKSIYSNEAASRSLPTKLKVIPADSLGSSGFRVYSELVKTNFGIARHEWLSKTPESERSSEKQLKQKLNSHNCIRQFVSCLL